MAYTENTFCISFKNTVYKIFNYIYKNTKDFKSSVFSKQNYVGVL